MTEGFAALTRVRRRQNAGVAEIARLYPALLANEAKPECCGAVAAAAGWSRGRVGRD